MQRDLFPSDAPHGFRGNPLLPVQNVLLEPDDQTTGTGVKVVATVPDCAADGQRQVQARLGLNLFGMGTGFDYGPPDPKAPRPQPGSGQRLNLSKQTPSPTRYSITLW
ncbi:MAG: hypothetical protein ABSH32_00065 [Bryobacteraceae bacterium]